MAVTAGLPALPAAAASATSAAAAATWATSLGFVDLDGSTIELDAIHRGDGLAGSGLLDVGYETEAAGTAAISIGDDLRFLDLAETLEGG